VTRSSPATVCFATAARRASRRLTALYDAALAPASLRSTQYAILQELSDTDGVSLGDLAAVLVLDRSGLGHSLRPLERDGLIRLEKSATDRRSVVITMTEAGRDRYEQASALWAAAQEQVATALGERAANKLRDQWNGVAAEGLFHPSD
jgi:DNA-binding MarR family transcriptional regulator